MAKISDLPLEVFRQVLEAAYRARASQGLRRAFRLRLVNRLFAAELLHVVNESNLLQDDEGMVSLLGNVGTNYICYRLLHTRLPVVRPWGNFPRIAAQLIPEDEPEREEKIATYVRRLCEKYADYEGGSCTLFFVCRPTLQKVLDAHYDEDLRCAAAYFNDIPVLTKLCPVHNPPPPRDPYVGPALVFAATEGHTEAVDALLKNAFGIITGYDMKYICRHAPPAIVRKLLPGPWTAERLITPHMDLDYQDARDLQVAMQTPHTETFDMLMDIKKAALSRNFQDITVMALWNAAGINNWVGLAEHLLAHGLCDEGIKKQGLGKWVAVRRGNVDMVRWLLANGWEYTGTEIGLAGTKGKWDLVRYFVAEGYDINNAVTPVIVSALKFERIDLVHEMMALGAKFDEQVKERAIEVLTENELDSMLDFVKNFEVGNEGKEKACEVA